MEKNEILEILKTLNVKNCNKEELLKIINLYEFLEKETLTQYLTKKAEAHPTMSDELKIRLNSINASIKTRKYIEKSTIENATFYEYLNYIQIYTKPTKNIEDIFGNKIDKYLEKAFQITVFEDNKSTILEKTEIQDYIEKNKTKSLKIKINLK